MSPVRSFDLGDVLSVTTGVLLSPRLMDGVYDILDFLTGDSLFTHQLPRAAEHCAPLVLRQHPDLAGIVVPELAPGEVVGWLADARRRYGSTRDLMPVRDWESRNPIEELCDQVGPERVYVLSLEELG